MIKYLIAISKINKIGPSTLRRLLNYYPDPQAIWEASHDSLLATKLNENLINEFVIKRKQINPDSEIENLQKENVKTVSSFDINYPRLLKEIHNHPFLLYYKGDLNNISEETIAVVGSRKITNYGRQVTERIVEELVAQDVSIVSGLALGVDSVAHISAIKSNKKTIAVLGSGLDRQNLYPASNRGLAEEIVEKKGLIISEYPLSTLPLKHNFPMRNRIISGLSLGTLVIEAGESSGALITSKFALEQNREVFAIPGNINQPMSVGTNNLIKQGAKLVQSAQDIFEELNIKQIKEFHHNQTINPDSKEEAEILKQLSNEQKHINELVKSSDFNITQVNSTLMLLEMKGLVKNLGNNTYIKSM